MNRSGRAEEKIAPVVPPPAEDREDLPEAIKYGDHCYKAERYEDALEAFSSLLETAPRGELSSELRARLHYRVACCHIRRSEYPLALEQLDLARKVLPRHLDKVRLAKIYARRGHIMLEMGQYERALRYLGWAKKLLGGTNEHEELGAIETYLGMVHARQGRSKEAKQCFLNALTTYRRIGDRAREASALNNLGLQYKNACEWREAILYLQEARTLFHSLGNRNRLLAAHLNLGIVHWKLGKWELCEENLTAADRIARELGTGQPWVRIQLALGNLALRRSRWEEAERFFEEAEGPAREGEFGREIVLAQEFRGELLLAQGRTEEAAQLLETALQEARRLAPDGDLVTETLRRLAEARLAQGRPKEALRLAKESAAAASRDGDRYEEAVALRVVGLGMMETGEVKEGERVLGMSLDSLGDIGESFQKGMTHLAYGTLLAHAATKKRSVEVLERASVQLQRASGAFLDLDARLQAAYTAYERALLETRFHRFEEAAAYRAKARQIYPAGVDPTFEEKLERLGAELEDAFAERWSAGTDVLTSLREMKRLFQGATDTGAVLEELLRLAVTKSGSTRGCVAAPGENGEIEVLALYGSPGETMEDLLHALGDSLTAALEENRPVWSNSAAQDERFRVVTGDAFGTESLVLLPLTLRENRTGVLYVDKTRDNFEGAYHQADIHLLTILANLAALSIVERQNTRLARENEELRARIAQDPDEDRFITNNPELEETLQLVGKVANSPVSILVEGETGTGKGLLVQMIHRASDRRDKPFVQINCAALPEQLLESELFGHVKGAFTGAAYNKVGLFKEAEQGTLFLDEVDKTSLTVQGKLLHVMDTKEVRPVGSVKSYRVDTRVICATNTNLLERIRAGEFLEDLYYRLNDFIVSIPPLRERREDVPLLLDYFLERFSRQYDRPLVVLTPEVRQALLDQRWRGNVRELEKTIRRLVVLADDDLPVGLHLLPVEIQAAGGRVHTEFPTLREEVARTEYRVIAEALKASRWNKAQVARTLKISYPCLLKKIKDHGLVPPPK